MKVAVIIPTIGRPELHDALASLRNQTRQPDEILVEHDPDEHGAAATRNTAARKTRADILLFLDDDCIAAPTWVERMCAAFESDPNIIAVAGSVTYRSTDYAPDINERVVQNPDARWFMGANCGVRREAFWKLGGFPEKYFVYEDKAFALACAMKNYTIARAPTASVYHARSTWTRAMIKKFSTHLTYWIDLMRDYDVWSDKQNPPPLLAGFILMPRDYPSFIKHALRFYNSASRLRAELLFRQRIALWRYALRHKFFIL